MNRKVFLIKNLIVLCCLFISCSSDDKIEDSIYINIPDSRFESLLINLGIDSDNEINQQILKKDAENISALNLDSTNGLEINDLTGIEGFVNLKNLSVVQNSLSNIDVSFNTLLDTLNLAGNYITSIDVSNNSDLIKLDLTANELSTITGLSKATHLKRLDLSFNLLEEFSIHNNYIETLFISDNLLKSFDVTGAVNLKNIFMKTNKITTVDLSSNTLLETLVLSNNNIQNVNLEQNSSLTHLYISSNSLTNLNVSDLQELIHLTVHNNPNLSCVKIQSGQNIPTVSKSDHQELNSICN